MVGRFSLAQHFSLNTRIKIQSIADWSSEGTKSLCMDIPVVKLCFYLLLLCLCHQTKQMPLTLQLPACPAPILTLCLPTPALQLQSLDLHPELPLYILKTASGTAQDMGAERTSLGPVTAWLFL